MKLVHYRIGTEVFKSLVDAVRDVDIVSFLAAYHGSFTYNIKITKIGEYMNVWNIPVTQPIENFPEIGE